MSSLCLMDRNRRSFLAFQSAPGRSETAQAFFTCLFIYLKQIPASACNWRSSLPPSGLDSSALHVCRVRAGHLPRRPSPLCLRPAASDAPPEVQRDLSSPLGAGAEQTEHKQISTAGRGGLWAQGQGALWRRRRERRRGPQDKRARTQLGQTAPGSIWE